MEYSALLAAPASTGVYSSWHWRRMPLCSGVPVGCIVQGRESNWGWVQPIRSSQAVGRVNRNAAPVCRECAVTGRWAQEMACLPNGSEPKSSGFQVGN